MLLACANEEKGKSDESGSSVTTVQVTLTSGTINRDIKCGNTAEETYDLYLPSSFSKDKAWPVIIAFDPQGDGGLPLENYKDLADEYGYVLAGSNYSKNGMEMQSVQQHYNRLTADLAQKVNINRDRFYLIGFSGGAKAATYCGLGDEAVDGIVACGAATNFQVPKRQLLYAAIAGKGDFNSLGMFYGYLAMDKTTLPYTFHYFDGKHEWPPKETIENTFRWFELDAMKNGLLETDKQKVSTWLHDSETNLGKITGLGNPLEFETAYKNLIKMYDGVADVSSYKEALARMKKSGKSASAIKQFEANFSEEEGRKSNYMKAIGSMDLKWWQTEIASLKSRAENGKGEDHYSAQRALGFLGLLTYMQASSYINVHKDAEATKLVGIYLLAEPENPEAHYLNAILLARKGNDKEAITSLKKAVEFGFNDKVRLMKEVDFEKLKSGNDFQKLLSE